MFGKINFPGKEQPAKPKPQPIITEIKTKQIEKKTKETRKKNDKVKTSLKGSKFRIINELLYTRPSEEAFQHFKEHKEDFVTYHEGFRQQATKWSQNPLHTIIGYLKKHHSGKNKLILDLGCGQAEISQKMGSYSVVRSFDLVAQKACVQVADIAHLPLQDHIADVAVFCLSLMGLNYIDFLEEAGRVLKQTGELLIAQVESRSKNWSHFVTMVQSLGFQCKANKTNNYFRILYFNVNKSNRKKLKIDGETKNPSQFSTQILGSCLYKKR